MRYVAVLLVFPVQLVVFVLTGACVLGVLAISVLLQLTETR